MGQQVRFDIALTQDGAVYAESMALSLGLHHIEDDKSVFKTDLFSHLPAKTVQQLQFFDGAPHRVTDLGPTGHATGRAERTPPLQAVFDMEVHGVAPPMAVKLRTLGLLDWGFNTSV